MDIEDSHWEEYENRFRALAERAETVKRAEPSLDHCRYFLCLYGENGLSPQDELIFLEHMAQAEPDQLKKIEVDTSYWQDTVLFLP